MKRVVSLTPGCTEIICALNCADQLVGRSRFCDFAPELRALPVCTLAEADQQPVQVDAKKVAELRPELVFTPNPLPDLGARTVEFDPKRLSDLWTGIQNIANELQVPERGSEYVFTLKSRLVDVIMKTCMLKGKPAVVCIESVDPIRVAGRWVPDLVDFAGGLNLFSEPGKPSSVLEWSGLVQTNPEIIILMPSGFGMGRARCDLAALEQKPEWHKLSAVKHKKVFIVDSTQNFSQPGPKLVDSQEILAEIIQPKLFRYGGEGKTWQNV